MSKPAATGPMKLETAGPTDSQLNTVLSSTGSRAARPTWRCIEMDATPVAPPVIMALKHNTGKTGNSAAKAVPHTAATTA